MTDRAVCTVAAFMQGAPVPPPGMAQRLIAEIYKFMIKPSIKFFQQK